MKHIKLFEKFSKEIAYHLTSNSNLESILKFGLVPSTPKDFGENGDINGIYLFKTLVDLEDALMNWLGDRIELWEEENGDYNECVVVVDISGLETDTKSNAKYEVIVIEPILPNRIIKIIKDI